MDQHQHDLTEEDAAGGAGRSGRESSPPSSPRETIERINYDLIVDALIWDRDSHGLFDYESKSLLENQLTASGCFMLARDQENLKTVMPKLGCPDSYKMLLSTVYKHGAYWIYHNKSLYK